jgi:hypothetical protein
MTEPAAPVVFVRYVTVRCRLCGADSRAEESQTLRGRALCEHCESPLTADRIREPERPRESADPLENF